MKRQRLADPQFPKIRMRRVEEKIILPGNQCAGNPQHRAGFCQRPRVSYCLERCGRGIPLPIPWQLFRIRVPDEGFFDYNFKQRISVQQIRRIEVYEHLECSQRLGLSSIDNRRARTRPTAAVALRSLAGKGGTNVFSLGDSPSGETFRRRHRAPGVRSSFPPPGRPAPCGNRQEGVGSRALFSEW